MKSKTLTLTLAAQAIALTTVAPAPAQEGAGPGVVAPSGGDDGESGVGAPAGPGVTVVQLPSQNQPFNPDAHLPSSSRSSSDISRANDGFDFGQRGGGAPSVRGGSNGAYVVDGEFTPEQHTVRRGDTLWEIATRYYQNPYQWPRVWAQNPQIQNPHWIYPGDRVRLREAGAGPVRGFVAGMAPKRRTVPLQTIFLRDQGWVDDKKEDTWGEIIGSPEDHLFLREGEDVYVQLDDKHEVQVGEELTIFRPIRTVGSDDAKGELVSIRGTLKVERYNPKTRTARAKVTEAIDVIERGVKVGPVGRKFDVVPPAASDRDLEAGILASLYPYELFGTHQLVFLDKGEKEGVKPGQRFFAITRGDPWIDTIGEAGAAAKLRPRVEDDEPAQTDKHPTSIDEDVLPDETYAELRVLRVRDHTAAAIVIAAKHEVPRNARLVSRKGM